MEDTSELKRLIEKNLADDSGFDPEDPSVRLAYAPYEGEEILEALESMLSTFVTAGDKVEGFEDSWGSYVGRKHAAMTNSGSSSNFLALKSIQDRIGGSEVIVPAVGWSTTVYPVKEAGAEPVFVDVDPETMRMDPESVKSALSRETAAVLPVHLFGNPAPMDLLNDLAEDRNLLMVEDCAQAHGGEYNSRKLGSFGDLSTFSFSFSHHITTMEGGAVLTDDEGLDHEIKKMRSWGREERSDQSVEFDFGERGYNLRPTEVQAAFGIHQVDRLDSFVEKRRRNADYMRSELVGMDQVTVFDEKEGAKCSYLHFPITLENKRLRDGLRKHLESRGIETRPMLSGNLAEHSGFGEVPSRDLSGAEKLHRTGMYVSCHHKLTEHHLDYIVDSISSFFS